MGFRDELIPIFVVAPAEAGTQGQVQNIAALDSRFRGNDETAI
jgi:hypothetical protein